MTTPTSSDSPTPLGGRKAAKSTGPALPLRLAGRRSGAHADLLDDRLQRAERRLDVGAETDRERVVLDPDRERERAELHRTELDVERQLDVERRRPWKKRPSLLEKPMPTSNWLPARTRARTLPMKPSAGERHEELATLHLGRPLNVPSALFAARSRRVRAGARDDLLSLRGGSTRLTEDHVRRSIRLAARPLDHQISLDRALSAGSTVTPSFGWMMICRPRTMP